MVRDIKQGKEKKQDRALGWAIRTAPLTLVRKVAGMFGEQMSQKLKKKSEVGSKESESFRKCDMGRKEIRK